MAGETLSNNHKLSGVINGITISPKRSFCIVKIWMKNCSIQNPSKLTDIPGLSVQGCIFKKHKPVPLGRWNTSNAERNAELANHDHCGGPQCSKVELTQYYDNSMDIAVCALQSFQLYPSKK